MLIQDRGDGWRVYDEWSDGVERPVFTGFKDNAPREAFMNSETAAVALQDCFDFVRERESYLAEEDAR
jgi:hypothetical protein